MARPKKNGTVERAIKAYLDDYADKQNKLRQFDRSQK